MCAKVLWLAELLSDKIFFDRSPFSLFEVRALNLETPSFLGPESRQTQYTYIYYTVPQTNFCLSFRGYAVFLWTTIYDPGQDLYF